MMVNSSVSVDNDVIADELPRALTLLTDLQAQCTNTSNTIANITTKLQHGDINVHKGLDFLDAKCELFVSYLMNSTYIMLQKLQGHSIDGDDAIGRIVEYRTYLEKMKPIEHKLKYQIDKLIKAAVEGQADPDDPLRFKPHPASLTSKGDSDSEDMDTDDEDKNTRDRSGLYRPPKLAAMPYNLDVAEVEQRKAEKAKKQAMSMNVLKELRDEYTEDPEEVHEHRAGKWKEKYYNQRIEYEEETMTRLPVTRKDKRMMHSSNHGTVSNLGDELTSFGDISAFLGGDDDEKELQEYRNSRTGSKKTKKKLGKKMKGKAKKKGKKWKKN